MRLLGCLALTAAAAPSSAQITIKPTFAITETLTDNRNLSTTDRRADSITTLTPGISISSRSGRVIGSLDYAANINLLARDSGQNSIGNSLFARATAEVIEKRFTVDTSASIVQQTISPFGVQGVNPNTSDINRTEVRSFMVAPALRGRLLGQVDYQGRFSYSISRSSDSNAAGDSSTLSGTFGVTGPPGLLSWGVNLSRSVAEFGTQDRTFSGLATGSLFYRPDEGLQFSLRAGSESSNFAGAATNGTQATYGGGLTWSPGVRTQAILQVDKRFFGNSHSVTFSHRFPRSIVIYTDSRDLSTSSVAAERTQSLFDLLFALLASQFPDPTAREIEVRNRLRAEGLDPNQVVTQGFLTSGATVQRRQNLSLSMQILRGSINLGVSQGTTSAIGGAGLGAAGAGGADGVRQFGLTAAAAYQLTSVSSLSVSFSRQRTSDAGTLAGNDLTSISAGWSSIIGPRTSVSATIRHTTFDSETNPYRESAISGSLNMRF